MIELVSGRDADRDCRGVLLNIPVDADCVVFAILDVLDELNVLIDRKLAVGDGRL